jgi:RNA polymerase sigma-70 factor, ECF subfamily
MEALQEISAGSSPRQTALTDEEIVGRVCAGEHRLFELLMRRHNRQIYRAARAVVHDESETEEVMQDAYVRAYEHLHEFEGRSRFSTWLTRIALHEAFARSRRRKRFEALDSSTGKVEMRATSARDPEQRTSDSEMRVLLETAIGALPENYRVVFILREVEGMKGAEVAECLGLPEATVKTRLFRARARLQDLLVASGGTGVRAVYGFHLSRCDRIVTTVLRRIAPPLGALDQTADERTEWMRRVIERWEGEGGRFLDRQRSQG